MKNKTQIQKHLYISALSHTLKRDTTYNGPVNADTKLRFMGAWNSSS